MVQQLRRIASFSREEFLQTRWKYKPGEHTTFVAPTQAGKSTLAMQLLQVTATPRLPAVVLVMKPRDPTMTRWRKTLGYRQVRSWPPVPSIWQPGRPPGWFLWPKHTFDPDRDDALLYVQFRRAILDCYKRGNRIVEVNELYGISTELDLDRELQAVWSRGASMGCGLWGETQRPAYVPLYAYSQAEHVFLGMTPDKRDRDRLRDIGGQDPDEVAWEVARLPKYHMLYLRRSGAVKCIVEP